MDVLDVIEDILSRLLVKDLLRCKSVCKSWYSLISSASFVKTHCKFMCNKEEYNARRIAMITFYKDPYPVVHEFKVPQEWRSYDKWVMVGSCNGLVCIYSRRKDRVCVTNPLTREFKELQQQPKGIYKEIHCLGFGYESSTDDYKVLMAFSQNRHDRALVRILSLKSNIWRLFGQIDYRFEDLWMGSPGILFNGALHWLLNNPNNTGGEKLLVSFDLAKEEFREIPQPDDARYVINYGYSLGILDGRLCIFLLDDDEYEFPSCGTWVMNSSNSWELLPKDSEMKDHAIHYMLKDSEDYRITPPQTYFCDENIQISRNIMYIQSPMFVQTLVSPSINNNGGAWHAKKNKSTVNNGSIQLQEKREFEKVYSLEERKKRKSLRTSLRY